MSEPEPLDEEAVEELDRRYRPFPSFEEWQMRPLNLRVWDEAVASLESTRADEGQAQISSASEGVLRAAAISTGAIEGLYRADRGFTMTVAEQASKWQQGVEDREPETLKLYQAQLAGYNMSLDAATKKMPISEAWIRTLHEVVTGPQDVYTVYTPAGKQSQPLPKGEYKKFPNHVRLSAGSTHSYAPVSDTRHEMRRLVDVITSSEFDNAHPVHQVSYVHYALAVIHPFADGNGRVARMVASVWLFRALSLPLVVFSDQVDDYLDSLAKADGGDYEAFIDVITERSVDSIMLALDLVHRSKLESPSNSISRLTKLLAFQEGVGHVQMDQFASTLLQALSTEFNNVGSSLGLPNEVSFNSGLGGGGGGRVGIPGFRPQVESRPQNLLFVGFNSNPPASAQVQRQISAYISTDTGDAFPFALADGEKILIRFRISEVRHGLTRAAQQRLMYLAEEIIGEMLPVLEAQAREALFAAGYRFDESP
jgi:Fic family protein